MSHLPFLEESGSFAVNRPENVSYLYFPLASDTGMKSAVTPGLGGDAKLDQETFLLEPVSAEICTTTAPAATSGCAAAARPGPAPALPPGRRPKNSPQIRRTAACRPA